MKKFRVDKAINVIKYAIKNSISVKEASILNGFSGTYVKNVKADVNSSKNISEALVDRFNMVYADYLIAMDNKSNEKINVKDKIIESNKPKDLPKGGKTSFKSDGNDGECEWVGSNYPDNHIKTLDDLLLRTNVDTDTWKVKDYLVNKWDVTSWKNGNPQTIENFQVKARLFRDVETVREKQVGEIFREMIKGYEPPVYNVQLTPKIETGYTDIENNLFEISIFDLHLGKLAWAGETFENYDTKIASKRFLDSISNLINRAKGLSYSKILFPVGSDFFNSDTLNNTTTKGTPQDEDLRWQKTFSVGCKLLVDAILILKQQNVDVDVIVIPGNHDFERSYYMGEFLSAWFNNDDQVKIDNRATPRKYYKFGKVLLGFTHGSEEKEDSLPMIMANDIDAKPHWSSTNFHEWHLGHIHRKRKMNYTVLDKSREINEDLGVVVRYLSSLSGTEEWHHKKGYIGSTKAAEGFIWNDETGLIANLNTNINIED